jgi:hypothetical protein
MRFAKLGMRGMLNEIPRREPKDGVLFYRFKGLLFGKQNSNEEQI